MDKAASRIRLRFFVLYCDKSATKLRDQIILWRIKYCCVFNGSNNKTFFYLYHKYCKTNCKTKKNSNFVLSNHCLLCYF